MNDKISKLTYKQLKRKVRQAHNWAKRNPSKVRGGSLSNNYCAEEYNRDESRWLRTCRRKRRNI